MDKQRSAILSYALLFLDFLLNFTYFRLSLVIKVGDSEYIVPTFENLTSESHIQRHHHSNVRRGM